jgi:DNA invertase Pin-like site-specific DNA recombinase
MTGTPVQGITRDGFRELIAAIEAGQVDVVIVPTSTG